MKQANSVVVIAFSVGGIEALSVLIGNLPANLEAAVVIAQHVSRHHPSRLAEILARQTPMPGNRQRLATLYVMPAFL